MHRPLVPTSDPCAGPTDMQIVTTHSDGTHAYVRVIGEVDLSSADVLGRALAEHLAAGRRQLRLDLSDVTFLDATGLTALLHAHHEYIDKHGAIIVTAMSPRVSRLIALTRLDEVFLVPAAHGDDAVRRAAPRPIRTDERRRVAKLA